MTQEEEEDSQRSTMIRSAYICWWTWTLKENHSNEVQKAQKE